MATFRTMKGRKFRSSLGASFRTTGGKRYRSSLGAGYSLKKMSKKLDKLSTVNKAIALGGGGAAGYFVADMVIDRANLDRSEPLTKAFCFGTTAAGALAGVHFLS